MKIYLAGPLFTLAEQQFNKELATKLLDRWRQLEPAKELVIELPQESCAQFFTEKSVDWPSVFLQCYDGVRTADIVLAILDGPDQDSGTCFEMGLACAWHRPIIGLRTDIRLGGDFRGVNIMPYIGCAAVLHCPNQPMDDVVSTVLASILEHASKIPKYEDI